MSDAKVETFKKSVAKSIDAWGKQVASIAKLAEELKKQRQELDKQLSKASMDLVSSVAKIDPPANADEKELAKVTKWADETIKKEFVPLSKDVDLDPGADFDGRSKKLIVGMAYSWKW